MTADLQTAPAGVLTVGDGVDGSYFDLAYYERLHAAVQSWRALGRIPDALVPSQEVRDACIQLLCVEARLLDQERLSEWLDLFTADCAYWIPSDVAGRDPRTTISWELHDRRRLEERVERLYTGRAYSQAPPTRTTHVYSNYELMLAGEGVVHLLCNFVIHTNFAGRPSHRAGWNGYELRQEDGAWRIVLKRVSLFDADLPQDNNSFTL